MDRSEAKLYQTIILTLDDGSKISFTGPAQVFPDDTRRVVNIKIFEPCPLPDSMKFELMSSIINAEKAAGSVGDKR